MKFEEFNVGDLIKLRQGIGTFPALNSFPEKNSSTYIPFYLNLDFEHFLKEQDTLIVLEKISHARSSTISLTYKCLFKNEIVYITRMENYGIDPNICFVKC